MENDRRTVLKGMSVATSSLVIAAVGAPGKASCRTTSSDERIVVISPDGKIKAELLIPRARASYPRWTAWHDGKVVLEPSRLALILESGQRLGPDAQFLGAETTAQDLTWQPPYGIRKIYEGRITQVQANFEDRRTKIRFAIRVLAHNDGIACRFLLLSAPGNKVNLSGEEIEFRLPPAAQIWSSRDEGEYAISIPGRLNPVPHPELTASTDKGALADTPILAALATRHALLLSESDRLHYPRMMLAPGSDGQTLVSRLMHYPGRATGYSGPGDTHPAPIFTVPAPFNTPWRVAIIGSSPADLIGKAGLIPTLATPSQLETDHWIRPGRAFRILKPYSMTAALEGIEFAVKRKLDFIEFDAHWYGDGTDPSDATVPIEGLDMPAIVALARSKGLGTILYVDRVPAMRQLDAIVATYRKWGVAGIKFGFIWEGRQEDTDWIYNLIKTCGENQLLVNLHDNLRPAGLERTLPNYVALEGVRGNEQFPTARHNVTLPFTRAISGPVDYTICFEHPRNQTTNAHQLAMSVVYYNPLTFLYWYDRPAKYASGAWPALHWFDECPTSWDATHVIDGRPGEFVAVARRHRDRWFLGAMTNEDGRVIDAELNFLEQGRWRATIFSDGSSEGAPQTTPVEISTSDVRSDDRLPLRLAPCGGQAIIFERA